jgi:hypothetical protein
MTKIKFDQPTYFDSRGRNGFISTHGLAVFNMGTGDFDEVHIHPVTSRGAVSEACRLAIRKSAIPDLVKALLDAVGPPSLDEICRHNDADPAVRAALHEAVKSAL